MIKNLLFDLGGVIMDIERMRCVRAFEALGLPDADSYFGQYAQSGIFMDLESGKITAQPFRDAVREKLTRPASDEQIDEAFTRFLIGIPESRLRMLEGLRKQGYGVYMLSNTNPIMWNSKIADEFRKEGFDMSHYFDGEVTSFAAGMAKPDPEIFRYAASKLGIEPAQTMFFDDSETNLEAAASVGYETCLVPEETDICDIIAKLQELHVI